MTTTTPEDNAILETWNNSTILTTWGSSVTVAHGHYPDDPECLDDLAGRPAVNLGITGRPWYNLDISERPCDSLDGMVDVSGRLVDDETAGPGVKLHFQFSIENALNLALKLLVHAGVAMGSDEPLDILQAAIDAAGISKAALDAHNNGI
jgi:hypothetical protein